MRNLTETAVLAYLILINAVTFVMFGIDKYKAVHGNWRISEKTLLTVSSVGGSAGGILAMELFRHKTRHVKFSAGLRIMFALHAAFCIYFFGKGRILL